MFSIELSQLLSYDKEIRKHEWRILSMDQLHLIATNIKSMYIINSEESFKNGSHWLALYVGRTGEPVEWFDSLANQPAFYNHHLAQFLDNLRQGYRLNTMTIQSRDSHSCGLYCYFFLSLKARGYSFDKIMKMFSSTDFVSNENIVVDYLDQV